MLHLPDRWAWDSWLADDGDTYHLYYLYAPRALADPDLRHARARIGHATSTDLVEWTDHGDTLGPDAGGWDDLALWTGSVVRGDDGTWRLFYTAINTRGHELRDQQIGVVESDDLHHWRRVHDGPVARVDGRWYKTLDEDPAASETWRDPFVFRDPGGDGWRMLITARAVGADRNDDGVLAQARSHDLLNWEIGPPVTEPGTGFGQLEVPQVREIDGQHVLVFTCHPQEQTDDRIERSGRYCTWSLTGTSAVGPWDIDAAQPFTAAPRLFAAPLARQRDGAWVLFGFDNTEPESVPPFDIGDPIPVTVVDGALRAR